MWPHAEAAKTFSFKTTDVGRSVPNSSTQPAWDHFVFETHAWLENLLVYSHKMTRLAGLKHKGDRERKTVTSEETISAVVTDLKERLNTLSIGQRIQL
jgi:hypothetical protein